MISSNVYVNYKMFIGLLNSLISATNHTKCVVVSNQKCMTQITLINLHLNECCHELCYHQFAVNIDKCVGSCNIHYDLSNKV